MRKKLGNEMEKAWILGMAFIVILLFALMLLHIGRESLPSWKEAGKEMFSPASPWRPVSAKPSFGLLPMIAGTLFVSGLAVILAMILGVLSSLYLHFYLPENTAKMILSFIDLTAGIPSVIFGLIGLTLVVPQTARHFKMAAGQSVLAASVVLGVMLIPFVVSSCGESVLEAKRLYELPALALGLSKEALILHMILPAVRKGILASAMMAFGRGLGETMAVMMVVGNSPIYPRLLGRAQTLPALTALEMGSVEQGSLHLSVLYTANAVLLVILFSILLGGYLLKKKGEKDEE
ncbi:MAG: phosphate ABC transporter permease subunit PstC [Peptostreptococcaceae bacterium]|nr:phosphate ABC transporter permease subunit PstC [Peptostreptococcaceae bacterium]